MVKDKGCDDDENNILSFLSASIKWKSNKQ